MSFIRQVLSITRMNLQSVLQRSGASIVIIVGIAGSVAVMVSLLAMGDGPRSTISTTGQEDRVIILRDGSNSELSSGLGMQKVDIILNSPGVKEENGDPLVAGEIYAIIDLKKKGAESTSNLPFRGVQQNSFRIRPELEIIDGRNFNTGTAEVIIGKGAYDQYAGVEIGDQIKVRDGFVTVVGIFSTGGDVHESEIWGDLPITQNIFRREGSVSSAIVRLESKDTFDDLGIYIENYRSVEWRVLTEFDFFDGQASGSEVIKRVGQVVGYIMAVGAIFAALNTMYSAVSTRLVEIGTLRALGFKGSTVLVSLMIEAMILAIIGGLLGAGIAFVLFTVYTVYTLDGAPFTPHAFAFAVTRVCVTHGTR